MRRIYALIPAFSIAWAACGIETDIESPELEAPNVAAGPPIAGALGGSVPMAAPGSAPVDEPDIAGPDLETLSRLPEGMGQVDRTAERLVQRRKPQDEAAQEQRVRVEFGKDAIDGPRSREERTQAGLAVDLSPETTLRGGVQVEEESGGPEREAAPTVGIEVRF